jgi:hypothetical protein
MRPSRRGAVLLETIIAVTVVATVGLATMAATRAADHARMLAVESERRITEASRFLEVVALWPREDLDLRLGERQQGPWRLHVVKVSMTLYRATLVDSTGVAVLSCELFRPMAAGS